MFKQQTRASFSKKQNWRRKPKTQTLDISKFINKAKVNLIAPEELRYDTFNEFDLIEQVKDCIAKRGFTTPTPIQDKAIPLVINGSDLLGIANTGTGKTGAFLIPLVNKVTKSRTEKVLIITPTRELALQILSEFNLIARPLGIQSVLCIGGTNMYQQRRCLLTPFNFVIGTPGRIKDLISQKALSIADFRSVVLDEVDCMLDMGFIHDIKAILSYLPTVRQSLFFSATVTDQVSKLIQDFSHNVMTVSVKKADTAETVNQNIIRYTDDRDKIETLHQLLIQKGFEKVLIFGRTKWGVSKLSDRLRERGFKADSIHGNKTQAQRQRALSMFRQNFITVLVATDVASRGLDIDGVTHVINYDIPATYDDYVHRIGRTGRNNKGGIALTFVS